MVKITKQIRILWACFTSNSSYGHVKKEKFVISYLWNRPNKEPFDLIDSEGKFE